MLWGRAGGMHGDAGVGAGPGWFGGGSVQVGVGGAEVVGGEVDLGVGEDFGDGESRVGGVTDGDELVGDEGAVGE